MTSPDHKRATQRELVSLSIVGGKKWFYCMCLSMWNFSITNTQESSKCRAKKKNPIK